MNYPCVVRAQTELKVFLPEYLQQFRSVPTRMLNRDAGWSWKTEPRASFWAFLADLQSHYIAGLWKSDVKLISRRSRMLHQNSWTHWFPAALCKRREGRAETLTVPCHVYSVPWGGGGKDKHHRSNTAPVTHPQSRGCQVKGVCLQIITPQLWAVGMDMGALYWIPSNLRSLAPAKGKSLQTRSETKLHCMNLLLERN